MSTLHRPAPLHIWWYAVGAALAALVAVLAVAVLGEATSPTGTDIVPGGRSAPDVGEKRHPSGACFATRPGAPTDLGRICIHHTP